MKTFFDNEVRITTRRITYMAYFIMTRRMLVAIKFFEDEKMLMFIT